MTLLQFWWHKFLFHLLPFSLFGWPLCLTIYKFFGDFVSQGSDVLLLFAHISITTVGERKSFMQRWSWSHPTTFFSLKSFKIQSNLPNKEGKGTEQIARIGGVSVLLIGHDYDVTYTIPQTVFKYILTKTGAHFDLLGRCLTEEQNQSYKAMV